MKKMALVLSASLITLFPALYAGENPGFEAKAREYSAQLEKKQSEYLRVKSRYEQMLRRLNELKERTKKNPVASFINSMKMDYYLKAGNSAGYKIYVLNRQIKELSGECFTYDSLVAGDLTKKFQDCIENKCGEAQRIYDEREKWTAMALGTGEALVFDIDVKGMLEGMSPEAKEDLRQYLKKKMVQIEERIYMLREEKEINTAAGKNGIKTASETVKKSGEEMAKFLRMEKEAKNILASIK
ncbi:MAG: hypothetical protein ABSA34_00135 [Candidatus Goldiibacteriota bacterium]|jgi:hypothetical protein